MFHIEIGEEIEGIYIATIKNYETNEKREREFVLISDALDWAKISVNNWEE